MPIVLSNLPLQSGFARVMHIDGYAISPATGTGRFYGTDGTKLGPYVFRPIAGQEEFGFELPTATRNYASIGAGGRAAGDYSVGDFALRRFGEANYIQLEYFRGTTLTNNFASLPVVHNGSTYGLYFNYTGSVLPAANNVSAFGSATYAWKDIFTVNAVTVTSDERLKDHRPCSLGLDFILKLNPVEYRWKEATTHDDRAIPAGARYHAGLLAQEVRAALGDAAKDSGVWCQETPGDEDSRQMLRYEELIAPLIKAVQQLTERIKALEEA